MILWFINFTIVTLGGILAHVAAEQNRPFWVLLVLGIITGAISQWLWKLALARQA